MSMTFDKSKYTVFSAVSGGLVLAYSLVVFMSRSSFQFGDKLGGAHNNSHKKNLKVGV